MPRLARVANRLGVRRGHELPGKRDDKAGFMANIFSYRHDCREYIMEFSGQVIVIALAFEHAGSPHDYSSQFAELSF